MNVASFATGERIDAITIAGQDCEVWEAHGISATVFPQDDGSFFISWIAAAKPGTGMLDTFLRKAISLAQSRKGQIVFVNVINPGLACHLRKLKIRFVEIECEETDFEELVAGGKND